MLHPPLLDELGLESAMRAFVDLFKRRTGVSVELTCDNLGRLRREEELVAFRIAQEGLFNVHRHSGSPRAEVRLARRDSCLEVTVRDWGKGIDAESAASTTSLGIAGMRERARLLGGKLEVLNASPGTLVRAEIHVE
jgi:signal transduction histidine kinase